MILLIDTSTPTCKTIWVSQDGHVEREWEAGRELADSLLGYLRSELRVQGLSWRDITGIGVLQGPGSFTGLRIGHTVMNTLADSLSIPIVGVTGDDWVEAALARLNRQENDEMVLPLYGRDANITTPKR